MTDEVAGLFTGAALDAKEFSMGTTRFTVRKLMPQEAKRVFVHHVSPFVGGIMEAMSLDEVKEGGV